MGIGRVWIASTLLLVTSPVWAAEPAATESVPNNPTLNDRFVFTLGAFYPRLTTAAALKPSGGGTGVVIDFEDTLDLDARVWTPTFGFFWRATENWRVDVEYFDISRSATRTLAAYFSWGDLNFTAGTVVDSAFDFSDLRISAAYAFFKRRDKELGVGLGLHVADLSTSIQAAGVGSQAGDVTAPLPVVNLYAMFALTDTWAFNMRADWLSLSYGDFAGDIRNMEMNAVYQPFRNVGFGIGVRSLVIDVDIDNTDWRGQARMVFQGPRVFATVSF